MAAPKLYIQAELDRESISAMVSGRLVMVGSESAEAKIGTSAMETLIKAKAIRGNPRKSQKACVMLTYVRHAILLSLCSIATMLSRAATVRRLLLSNKGRKVVPSHSFHATASQSDALAMVDTFPRRHCKSSDRTSDVILRLLRRILRSAISSVRVPSRSNKTMTVSRLLASYDVF